MSNRILFVDDEPMVLKGLERSLRGMRNEWEMQFVPGGAEALDAMAERPFDVVISDMRMPGMDGAQLLEQVRSRFSQTVRMVLSGQSDKDEVFRAIRPTHQYLSKPCDVEELKDKLKSALALRDVLESAELKQRVSQIENVPSIPSSYRKLRAQLESEHPDVREVAETVCCDPGMTAKLLQLVNSAFLGTASRLSCPRHAASIIGLDNLRTLVSRGLFCELAEALTAILTPVWNHVRWTARFAKTIAQCENLGEAMVQNCYAAGLLHEIGWIVLGSSCGEQFKPMCSRLNMQLPRPKRETAVFGARHGLVGSYLLGLWGLPDCIAEAAAGHHFPVEVNPTEFCPLVAVHVANTFDQQWHGSPEFIKDDAIDEGLLGKLGLLDRLPEWEQQCRLIDGAQ